MIVGIDTEHQSDEALAESMLADLCKAYPGHAWFVLIRGGMVHIKNLHWSDKWGMAIRYSQIKADAAERRKSVVRAAGEFLERANVKRGAKDETPVIHIEGIEDKHLTRIGL